MNKRCVFKGCIRRKYPCHVAILRDCVEKDNFFIAECEENLEVKKIGRRKVKINLLSREQDMDLEEFNKIKNVNKNEKLLVIVNDQRFIINITKIPIKEEEKHEKSRI